MRRSGGTTATAARTAAAAVLALACLATAAAAAPPQLHMAASALRLPRVPGSNSSDAGEAGSVLVGVVLDGATQRPVSVRLEVLLPPADGSDAADGAWRPADPAQLWVDPVTLAWAAGNASSTKSVRLHSATGLPLGLALAPAAGGRGALLRVRLANASGAAVADARGSTDVLPAEGKEGTGSGSSAPLFGYLANQAAYPPAAGDGGSGSADGAAIPVRLLAGQLSAPVTLRYTLRLFEQPSAQFLRTRDLQGLLRFDPPAGNGSSSGGGGGVSVEQAIRLPLAWDRIPPAAQYRVALKLEGLFGALVAPQAGAVALHIFGTPLGTCPPGAALINGSASGIAMPGAGDDGSPRVAAASEDSSAADSAGSVATASEDSFLFSPGSSAIKLSSSTQAGSRDYGAMVAAEVEEATLCLHSGISVAGKQGGVVMTSLQSASLAQAKPVVLQPLRAGDVADACCNGTADGGDCPYAAWELELLPGQNWFNISKQAEASDEAGGVDSGSQEEWGSLAVVRRVDPSHAELASITVRASDNSAVLLCARSSGRQPNNRAALDLGAEGEQNGSVVLQAVLPNVVPPPCRPDVLLSLNVSDASSRVSLTPALRFPDIPGVRVEVNGQVLSRGGDVAADQAQDTTAAVGRDRSRAPFLPSAFIMGLQPGAKVDVEVVVVAEDSVTTARYPIQFVLVESPQRFTPAAPPRDVPPGGSSGGAGSRELGWPLSPAEQGMCSVCMAGWAAAGVNASVCTMCAPGTCSPSPQSPACLPCRPGTFAYSWGSQYCKNCIEGTVAPEASSSLCTPCPAGTTTTNDGSAVCDAPLAPDSHLSLRYAVVVSFSVVLPGLEPEDVVVRAGVAAAPEAILSYLLAADTAKAFNISKDNVFVVATASSTRRTLAANVTALLRVEVPDGATDADIAAALEVERLSADEPVRMLSSDPDRFFGRTTRTLEATVEARSPTFSNLSGRGAPGLMWGMLAPGILAVLTGSVLVVLGCRRSRACARWRSAAAGRLGAGRAPHGTPTSAVMYSRYDSSGGIGTSAAPASQH